MRQGKHSIRRPAVIAAAAALVISAVGVAGTRLSVAAADTDTAAVTTAGCGKTPTLTSGTHSMQVNGKNRSYILKVPDNYNSSHPYRLIFGIHWLGGNATDVANGGTVRPYYGLQALANNSAIFVAPQGLSESMGTGWANTGGQDVAFVDQMVKTIEAALCVDTTQLFSLGFSFGGGMSYALACARAKVFRAVAIYDGGLISGCAGGSDPIAYFQVHGVGDTVLPMSMARTMRDRFVKNNRCTAASPPEAASGSGTHTSFTYSGCASGYPIEWYTFDGGHTPVPTDRNGGAWLPAATWKFFTQFQSTTPPTGGPTVTDPPTTKPPTTKPPTTKPPTTKPPAESASCRVGYTVNSWNTGLTAAIAITNTGDEAIDGWSLVFNLPAGQTITSGWNATYSPTSGQVTAVNANHNGGIAPGASVSVGFQAAHNGDTATPTAFTLNGATCTVS